MWVVWHRDSLPHLPVSWPLRGRGARSWWRRCTKRRPHPPCSPSTPRSWASTARRSPRSRKLDRGGTPWRRNAFSARCSVWEKSVCISEIHWDDKNHAALSHVFSTYRKEAPFLCFGIIFLYYVYWWLLAAKPTDNQQDFFGTWKHPQITSLINDSVDNHRAKSQSRAGFLPNLACVRGPCISLLSSGLKWNFLASSTRSRHGRLHRMRG